MAKMRIVKMWQIIDNININIVQLLVNRNELWNKVSNFMKLY